MILQYYIPTYVQFDRLVTKRELCKILGITINVIDRLIYRASFPRPNYKKKQRVEVIPGVRKTITAGAWHINKVPELIEEFVKIDKTRMKYNKDKIYKSMTSDRKSTHEEARKKNWKVRTCLRCDRKFDSYGIQNRICPACKKREDCAW